MLYFALDDQQCPELPSGYEEPSMKIDEVSRSCAYNCLCQLCFRKNKTDNKYDQLTSFTCTLRSPKPTGQMWFCQLRPRCFCAKGYSCNRRWLLWMSTSSWPLERRSWKRTGAQESMTTTGICCLVLAWCDKRGIDNPKSIYWPDVSITKTACSF